MKRRFLSGLMSAVMLLLILCTGAGAESDGEILTGLLEAGERLMFETNNVTIEGTASFALDGYTFKKAEATYVQDGTNSLWRLKLLTPWPDGERVTGFTVIANGQRVFVMEDYHPGLYRTGTDDEQDTLVQRSRLLEQLIAMAKAIAPEAERAMGEHLQTEGEGQTAVIQLKGEETPETAQVLMNLGAQLAARRLFRTDYDWMREYGDAYLEDFTTITSGILATTDNFRAEEISLRISRDGDGRITAVTGRLELDLENRNEGHHRLSIEFGGEAGKYGESEVKTFDPEVYGVTLQGTDYGLYSPEGNEGIEGDGPEEGEFESTLFQDWTPGEKPEDAVTLPIDESAFSETYQRIRQAEQALADRYGLQAEMLTFFSRKVTEEEQGVRLTLTGMNDYCQALGTYTAVVTDGGVETAWSHDGENAEGEGFSSPVWGIRQLEEMLVITKRDREVVSFYNEAVRIAAEADPDYETPFDDLLVFNDSMLEPEVIRAGCRYTIEELGEIGRQAVRIACGLTEEQAGMLLFEDDMPEIHFLERDGRLVYMAWLYLGQRPFPTWTEKDGIYEVLIDAENGSILDIIYDASLNGNG